MAFQLTQDPREKDTQPMSQQHDENVENVAPSDSQIWALLFWLKGDHQPERLTITKDSYSVGRGAASDIILNEGNCRTKMDNLSRVHCTFRRNMNSGQLSIEDNSSNGCYVNGIKVGRGKTKVLVHGDEIAFTCKLEKAFIFVDFQHKQPGFPADITNKYVLVKMIGKGSFGEVWMAVDKTTNKKFAIKSVRRQSRGSECGFDAMEQLKNEASLLCDLTHPCIVKVEDVVCRAKSIHLMLELMTGGDLQAKIGKRGKIGTESTAKYFFTQLVIAVEFFHSKGIVHRDLKPENILLSNRTDDAVLKISDFGLSKFVDENTMLKTYCGTPLYLAPEVIEAKSHDTIYTSSCDVWSLGVILFMFLSGYHPFSGNSSRNSLERLISKAQINWRPDRWSGVSREAKNLVKGMLKVRPEDRLSIPQILNHAWLNDPAVHEKIRLLVFNDPNSSANYSRLRPSGENDSDQPLCKRQRTDDTDSVTLTPPISS